MNLHEEIADKIARLKPLLDRHGLDGVYLQRRNNFAWITGGRDNHIANSSPAGVAGILVTRDGRRVCFTNTIEGPRFGDEELRGCDVDVVTYSWFDASAGHRTLKEMIAGRKIAADVSDLGEFDHFGAGMSKLPAEFVHLRCSLTPAEIDRYRDGARRTSGAMKRACRAAKPGMSEHEIAGILDDEVHRAGCNPVVTLIAADERIEKFRHPIPTDNKLRKYVMLVTCAEFGGLISNMTRFVHFGAVGPDLAKKNQACANVDAMVNLSTRPGRTLAEMFGIIRQAYADNGFPGEEAKHHQGGPTGYAGREAFATPDSRIKVLENQAFAWNPSITGTKFEDTMLVKANGIELLTQISNPWPRITGTCPQGELVRAGMLVV